MKRVLDLSKVEFSTNDIEKNIKVPRELTPELAYFLGFHVGDGYLKIQRRGATVDYRLSYDGHSINEFLGYNQFIKPLIHKLFNKEVNVVNTKTGTVNISFRSKAILTFLHFACGISGSPKRDVDVPALIKNSSPQNKAAFIRGIADTDFSLVFKRNGTTPVIGHMTCSEALHTSLKLLLGDMEFNYSTCVRHRKRKETQIIGYQLEICGKRNLQRWMDQIGFSSYNTLTRYLVWKETGRLPPQTDINGRIVILKKRGIKFPFNAPDQI